MDLVRMAAAHPPTPGRNYSNTDYILLGMIIETVTGQWARFPGLSFITADGARQITATATLWTGTPRQALTDLVVTTLCP